MQEERDIKEPVPEERKIEAIEYPRIDREKCTRCFKCVDTCTYEALNPVSNLKTVKDIFQDVMKDALFYESSGGGFTVSEAG